MTLIDDEMARNTLALGYVSAAHSNSLKHGDDQSTKCSSFFLSNATFAEVEEDNLTAI